jgi:hypothetical protein
VSSGLSGDVRDFGAKCDGVTDDREAIQSALNTVVVLLFPSEATCVVNASPRSIMFRDTLTRFALSIPSYRALYLNGSTVKLGNGQNAHLFINSNIEGNGNHDIAILGPGIIDLNKSNQTTADSGEQSGGLMDQITNLTIRDIVFTNVREYALRHFRVTEGYYDNLMCTDSDGSCFAFGIAAVGGPSNCYFGHITANNAAGTSSAGAQGNPFISYGSHNTLLSLIGNSNRFGFKLQDGASDWVIGRIHIEQTRADKGVKIMGSRNGTHTERIQIGEITTSKNFYEGLYIWESDDVEISRVVSQLDAVGTQSAALTIDSSANGIAINSISVQHSNAGGVSLAGSDIDVGQIFVRDNGVNMEGQDNVGVRSTGQRIRIRSLISVDDQHPATIAHALGIHSGAANVDVQSLLPIGSFILDGVANDGSNVRLLDYRSSVKQFLDGDISPSVQNGMLFTTVNSKPTDISNFNNGTVNQEISVLCGDSHTTFRSGEGLQLATPMICTPGNLIRFIFDGVAWSETGRTFL